jgi:hypothetical protein
MEGCEGRNGRLLDGYDARKAGACKIKTAEAIEGSERYSATPEPVMGERR